LARSTHDPTGAQWGLGYALAGFVVGLVLSSIVASLWFGAHPGAKDLSLGGQAVAQIGLWIGLVGAPVLASRRHGTGRLGTDYGFRGRLRDVPAGAAVGVLGQAVLVPVIAFVMSPVVGHPDVGGPVEDLVKAAHGLGLVVLVVFVVVCAPVVEELFFRGLLLRSLERRAGTVWAIVVSSVLFGLAHPEGLPLGAQALVSVSLAALAAVLATLAVRTGRLGPSIAAHAVFNAWTVVFLVFR
jgi:membrane protease YdiL (CAAX protease family)